VALAEVLLETIDLDHLVSCPVNSEDKGGDFA
jgi:hypothetical protein